VFPDLYVTNSNFDSPKKLTNIHPEIPEYNWGYTEMVKYTNSRGDTLQGYVIKPYDFDPNKKYPLFVYFYEKFSDRRHQFVSPKILHRPIYPWYVSQGYCMFFPDIKFYDGVPGESGMDAVVAGCQKLIDDGYIDKDKIALHGHSWSGYQSAFFATQTDFFTAVVTGAPVANMTSAYSGIRLGSGMARQFQYEQMQSRIGGNIIDSLDAYIANSPIFFADKMNTPMLIMFGDIDDAVPWQQGIELYLACRRFEKPCIMLQYEKEPHHLKKYPNKLDYTIKMKQFFDHYVLGKPAENWILEGMEYKGKPQTMKVEKIK
jgi:dipeptidyl aminopeptidase/acylaminoacyl peptidase